MTSSLFAGTEKPGREGRFHFGKESEMEKKKVAVGEEFPCEKCGKMLIKNSPNHRVCPDCRHKLQLAAVARYNERVRRERLGLSTEGFKRHKSKGPDQYRSRKADDVSATAKCPMCKKLHTVKGLRKPSNGTTPYVYCEDCRPSVSRISESYSPTYGFLY